MVPAWMAKNQPALWWMWLHLYNFVPDIVCVAVLSPTARSVFLVVIIDAGIN
jgi:hypothetical protein